MRTGAWSAPAIVVASAAPAYASSPPVPPVWAVTTSTPAPEGSIGSYPMGFSVNVTSGSLGILTCTFTPKAGGFIGDSGTPSAFLGWAGTGTGDANGDQRAGWVFQHGINPVTGPILINLVGVMDAIAQGADLPMSIVFAASADGSQRAFTMTGLGGNSAVITPDPPP